MFQIFDDEYAVLHPRLEHSSSVSVLKSPLLAVPTFEITDRAPSRLIFACSSAIDQVSAESILHSTSLLLRRN